VAAVVVGMAVQASISFGFGFFVAPAALAVFRPAQAVTLLLLLALLINSLILGAEGRQREIDKRSTVLLCLWALPGIVGGALVVRELNTNVLQVAIGVGIVLAAAFQARSSRDVEPAGVPHRDRTLGAGGLVSGVLTTATSLNGPTVVLTLTRAGLRAHLLRDTAATIFLVLAISGTVALATLAHSARSVPPWPLLVALIPAVAVGHQLGAALFRRLDAERHRRLVLGAAIVAGTVSIVAGIV
jgi:uncharacterized protein